MDRISINLLGPLEVRVDGRVVDLGGPKPRAVLTRLAIDAGRVVSVDQLVEAGWGEDAPIRAANSIPVYISQLRKALGASRIETKAPGYRLALQPGELDLEQFDELRRAATIAAGTGDHAGAAALLRQALGLWRGDALAEMADLPFALADAARLEEARLVAIEERIEADLALGHHNELVGELEAVVAAHPLRERLRAQLMLALYRSNRQAEALRAYQDLRRALGEELGIDPSRELASLEEAMLLQRPELEFRGAVAPSLPPSPDRTLPPTLGEGGLFVGRGPELEALLGLWDKSKGGVLHLAAVTGDPGIGKTRLVAELAQAVAADGGTVVYGRCDDEAAVPYRPFVEALRQYVGTSSSEQVRALSFRARELVRLVPELAERVPGLEAPRGRDSDTERYFLFEAVVAMLAAAARGAPLLLALDDMHWADKPTRLLLRHVLQRLVDAPVLLVVASRDTDVLVEVDRERRAHRLRLAGLNQGDVAQLVAATVDGADAELAAAVHEETDGNPFFVGEVLRNLAETPAGTARVPEGVRELIHRRLARLSDASRRVLLVGAVMGREFHVSVVEQVVELPTDDILDGLDEAAAARVIAEVDEAPGRYRFVHSLVHEAIYGGLSVTRQARMHLAVAEGLERFSASRPDKPVEELAHQFAMGAALDDRQRGVTYCRLAAEQALRSTAFESAIGYYRQALDLDPSSPSERIEILLALGDAEWRAASTRQAPQTFADAAALARELGDASLFARAALGYAAGHRLFFFESGLFDQQAIDLIEEALTLVGPGDSAIRSELLGCLARQLYLVSPYERRRELCDESVAIATRLGDEETLGSALFYRYNALRTPFNVDERIESCDRLLELGVRLGDRELVLACRLFRVMDLLELGDIEGVDAEFEPQAQLASEVRQPNLVWITTLHQCMRATLMGRFSDAERFAQEALETGTQTEMSFPVPVYGGQVAVLRTLQGRVDEIEGALRVVIDSQPEIAAWRAGLAFALVECGRHDEALEVLHTVPRPSEVPHDIFWSAYIASMAEACGALDVPDLGAEVYDTLLPLEDNNIVLALGASCWGSVAHFLGVLATALGRYDAADAHFQAALDRNGRMGAWPLLGRTQLAYARMLVRRDGPDDREHADNLLDAATEIAEDLRMKTLGEQAVALRSRLS